MNVFDKYAAGLKYQDFLDRYGSDEHRRRWAELHAHVTLSAAQRELLASFRRDMPVLCLAGAWCGDCVNQCPIFDHFAAVSPKLQIRYVDRDADPELTAELKVCGGARVPVMVFFSEDGAEIGRYGDRTISRYRQLAQQADGAVLSDGDRAAASRGNRRGDCRLATRIRTHATFAAAVGSSAANPQRLTFRPAQPGPPPICKWPRYISAGHAGAVLPYIPLVTAAPARGHPK